MATIPSPTALPPVASRSFVSPGGDTPAATPSKYPKGVIIIIMFEAVIAFSHYGVFSLLTLYMTKQLLVARNTAKTAMHTYKMLAAFSPLFGAILADSLWGKYNNIAGFGSFYSFSYMVLVLVAIPALNLYPKMLFVVIALGLHFLGHTGFGPSLSSFGGDQFVEGQENQRRQFYSMYYFTLNAVVIFGMLLFPILRKISCMGQKTCYPLAFGLALVIFTIGFLIFVCARPIYRRVRPSGTVLKNFFLCILIAIIQRFKSPTRRDHWLDRADVRFSPEFINNVKIILSLIVLYLPIPMYEALYSQMDTTWTIQSDLLDGRLFGDIRILPEMVDLINPILVIILIPLLDFVIYPALGKINILKTPLQRMCTGGFFVALSFALAGFLSLKIEADYPPPPKKGHVDVLMVNSMDCPIDVYYFKHDQHKLEFFDTYKFRNIPVAANKFTVVPSAICPVTSEESFTVNFPSSTVNSVVVGIGSDGNITMTYAEQESERHSKGYVWLRFIYLDELPFPDAVLLAKAEGEKETLEFSNGFTPYFGMVFLTNYDICWAHNGSDTCVGQTPLGKLNLYKGAIAEAIIVRDNKTETTKLKVIFAVLEDHIHLLYQFPQYLFISIGEVMLSVTALSFNYSQAPLTFKAVVAALWYLTRSFGNMFVVIVLQVKDKIGITYESEGLFFFAAMMTIDMLIFAFLCHRYTYKTPLDATA